ncbi:hypothetical protein AAHA92_16750 [Salvia divinorum]|uniref:Uncharacterized protein n=1 Tax=Salvia divinorum TaxID=28513 RepID=A0ABD1H0K2_SALDI
MGTEVLYSQDLLAQRLHIAPPHFHHRRNFPSQGNLIVNQRSCHNNNSNRKTSPQSDKRKSNATKGGDARRKEGGGGVQVTILRRGQSLSCIVAKLNGGDSSEARSRFPQAADDMTVGRIRPKQIHQSPLPLLDVYAGSAFSLSPSPRSLPLPSFFNKKQVKINPSDDPATRDLRRLLRLD